MRIGVLGINHKSADVQLRERFAKSCQRRFGARCSAHGEITYVLLSTCNRTEIYFSTDELAETHTYLLSILRNDLAEEDFEHKLYSYFGSDCFFHLARVTSGIDSAIIGETEIQGQVKSAYEAAAQYRTLSKDLHFLFQKSLKIGKGIRASVTLKKEMPSIEELILNTGHYILGGLGRRHVLFVGISEINLKIFNYLKQYYVKNVTFCNRTLSRTGDIASKENVFILPWEQLENWIHYDLVIFGTKAPDFLIKKETFDKKMGGQKLIIDLCIPRNVDPKIGRIPGITLLNVDQINRTIDRKRKMKAIGLARLESHIIADAIERQMNIFKARELFKAERLYTCAS